MTQTEIKKVLSEHKKWLNNNGGERADLRGADLRESNLRGAALRGAVYSIDRLMVSVNWGELSDRLTLELMRHDAEYIGIDKMNAWEKGDKCPYDGMERDFKFKEKRKLWKPGKPKLRGLALWKALCKEKKIKISI